MKEKVCICLLTLSLSIPVHATVVEDDTNEDKKITMKEVVVTATRGSKDTSTVPANVIVISSDDIADSGASSIVEILQSQANVPFVSYSGNASQAMLDLRGFGENGHGKTLVLLDGRRLNHMDMSPINWTQLPLEQIERIEIVRGSNSVLYGNAAVAGVIQIFTKKGSVDPSISGSLQIGDDGYHNESAGIIGSSEELSYSVNVSNQQTNGWRERTGFHAYGGSFQLGYDIEDNLSISGGASFNRSDFEMPKALTLSELAQDRTQSGYPDNEGENEYQNVNILVESLSGDIGNFEINFVYGNSEIITDQPSEYNIFTTKDNKSIGAQPKYTLTTEHGNFNNELVIGVDIYHDTITVESYTDITRVSKKLIADFERDTIGWYFRDEIFLNKNIMLHGGARIERAEVKGKFNNIGDPTKNYDEETEHDGKVFEFGITVLPRESLKLFAKYAILYRYPFIDEQATYYASPWGSDYFNSDLKAEKGKNFEAGLLMETKQNSSFGVTLYQIDMEDEIGLNLLTYRNENLDDTRRRGLDLSFEYDVLDLFNLQIKYTYQESTFEAGSNEGKDIPLVPNNIFTASIDLMLPQNFHLIPSILYVDDSYLSGDTNNSMDKLNDYTVVDLLLRHKGKLGQMKLTTFLCVKNLFDEEYSSFGLIYGPVYYPAPGRKYYGGISGTF